MLETPIEEKEIDWDKLSISEILVEYQKVLSQPAPEPDKEKFPYYRYHRLSNAIMIDGRRTKKWNEEEVLKRNKMYSEEWLRLRSEYAEKLWNIKKYIFKHLAIECSISEQFAEKVWCFSEKHNSGKMVSFIYEFSKEIIEFYYENEKFLKK